jgi:hypothetical protein
MMNLTINTNPVKSRDEKTFGAVVGNKYQLVLQVGDVVLSGPWMFADDKSIQEKIEAFKADLSACELVVNK